VFVLAPLAALAGVIALFVLTGGAGLNIKPVVPIETVQPGRTILRPGQIELHLRNTSPQPIALSQININEATWPYIIAPGREIPRLARAVVTLDYPWVEGEAYEISLISSNSIQFTTAIPVATATAGASAATLWSFTLIGIYVGIIPILLGMFWLPVLARLGERGMLFLMSATVGLLVFLGIDTISEALELAAELSGTFQGVGIVGIGVAGSWLLLDALARHQRSIERNDTARRMSLATVIAVGIGLHNLGEGLAIGAAYAVGAAALGTFLVIGFIIQNVTEGLGIVAPIAGDRPGIRRLAVLGLIGGGPAIAGAWVGGLVYSQPLAVFFLAVGTGALFQVAFEIGRKLVWKSAAAARSPLTIAGGVVAGMLVLFVTGLAIK
jgi:zinc transporter ZupT